MPSLKGCCEARESPTARAERTWVSTWPLSLISASAPAPGAPRRLAPPRPALTACARGSGPRAFAGGPAPGGAPLASSSVRALPLQLSGPIKPRKRELPTDESSVLLFNVVLNKT